MASAADEPRMTAVDHGDVFRVGGRARFVDPCGSIDWSEEFSTDTFPVAEDVVAKPGGVHETAGSPPWASPSI